MEIKVFGPGCNRCDSLEKMVMEVLEESGIAASVEHVTDIREISQYGVMGTPALLINGKVVSVGTVPQKHLLKKWLESS